MGAQLCVYVCCACVWLGCVVGDECDVSVGLLCVRELEMCPRPLPFKVPLMLKMT